MLAETQRSLEHLVGEVNAEKANAERLAVINSSVLDATVDGIIMVDLAGNPVVSNAAMGRLFEELGLPRVVWRSPGRLRG